MPDYQVFDEIHRSRLKVASPSFGGSMAEVYAHLNGRRPEMHELSVKNTKADVISRASIWFVAARRVIITDLVKIAIRNEAYPDDKDKPTVDHIANQIMEMF